MKKNISTPQAPAAIGTYSQAIQVGSIVYLSGQIPLNPATGQLISAEFSQQVCQVFDNLTAVCQAAGGSLADIVKLSVFLTDLTNFATLNQIMAKYIVEPPYPARVTVQVSALPLGAQVEMDAVMHLTE